MEQRTRPVLSPVRRGVWLASCGVVLAMAGMSVAVAMVASGSGVRVIAGGTFPAALAISPSSRVLFVADLDTPDVNGAVRALSMPAGRLGRPVRVSGPPSQLVITPDGRTLFATDGSMITPVDVRAGRAGHLVRTGIASSWAPTLVLSGNGRILYVAGQARIRRYDVAVGRFGKDIPAALPAAMALSPNGRTLWYASDNDQVIVVGLATGAVRARIAVKPDPIALAMAPDGRILYVAVTGSGNRKNPAEVVPIDTATGAIGRAIRLRGYPSNLAMAPDGRTLYVVLSTPVPSGGLQNPTDGWVTPITLATHSAGPPIRVGYAPSAIAITRNGSTLYVANQDSDTISVISIKN